MSYIGFSKEELHALFHYSADIEVKVGEGKGGPVLFVSCKPLADASRIQNLPLPEEGESSLLQSLQAERHEKSAITRERLEQSIFSGKLLVVPPGDSIYFYDIGKAPVRQPDESVAEVSVRGPKDGFVEDIQTNIGLIRKRLRTASLVVEDYTIGSRSNTRVSLLYMKDIINQEILEKIRHKLTCLELDVLTSNTMLVEHLYENKWVLSPLITDTGRADFVVESINQGRFAIVMDGAPTVLIAPVGISYLFKTPEDENISFYFASLERFLRLLGMFITTFLPGFYTALVSHHVGQMPLPLVATIAVSRLGLPFSTLIEMLLMLFMIELFKEGGARLPKGIGQTVAVLGGLIIGDAAIRGGITSPTMLVVIGVTAISSFTLSNQSLAGNLFFMRIFVLIISYVMGMYGFVLCLFTVFLYIARLNSFGVPYLSNISSPEGKDIAFTFFRIPFSLMKKRNPSLDTQDDARTGE